MSKRIPTVTKELIVGAAVPPNSKTYCAISHQHIIDTAEKILADKGFEIRSEQFKCTKSASVAQGIYYLNYGDDPETKMMFAFSNSYDKSMKFRCGVGGYIENGACILPGTNVSSWSRKHTGTALEEATNTITDQISQAGDHYKRIISDKLYMEGFPMTLTNCSHLSGRLFIELDAINTEQVSMLKDLTLRKPPVTLWDFYRILITTLQRSHPAKWMEGQTVIHTWLCKEYSIPEVTMTPDPIHQYPVTIEEAFPGPGHQVTLEESIKEVVKETGEPETVSTGFQPLTEPTVIEKNAEGEPLVSVQFGTIDFSEVGSMEKVEYLTPEQILEKFGGQLSQEQTEEIKNHKKTLKAEDLVEQIKQQAKEAEETSNPGIQNTSFTIDLSSKDFGAEVHEKLTETFALPVEGEVYKEQPEPHMFTVDTEFQELCNICGKDYGDQIHDV